MSKSIGTVSAPGAGVRGGVETPNEAHVSASRAGVEFRLEGEGEALFSPDHARELACFLERGAEEAELMADRPPAEVERRRSLKDHERRVRGELRRLGFKVAKLADQSDGELEVEARRAWLLADLPLGSPEQLDRALVLTSDLVRFIENYTDSAVREDLGGYFLSAADACDSLLDPDAREPVDADAIAKVRALLAERAQREDSKHVELRHAALAQARAATAAVIALVDYQGRRAESQEPSERVGEVRTCEGDLLVRRPLCVDALRLASAAGTGAFVGVAGDGEKEDPADVVVRTPPRGELAAWREERQGKVVDGRRWLEVLSWSEVEAPPAYQDPVFQRLNTALPDHIAAPAAWPWRVMEYRATCDATNNPPSTRGTRINIRLQALVDGLGVVTLDVPVPIADLAEGRIEKLDAVYVHG
jgi:hypothetical protein